jgi:hypothetical protein
VAVMATIAKGHDLDYAWRVVGEAYRGAGYYLAATEAGEPPGTWWGPGAERLGFATGQQVDGSRTTCCLASGRALSDASSAALRRTPGRRLRSTGAW